MFQSIIDDIKREYSYGNMVTRIVITNVVVFIAINMVWIIARLSHTWQTPEWYNSILHSFMVSSDWFHNLTHPWAFFTHMYMHEGFWHLLWNMLILYWFGRIVGDLIGNQRILPIYLISGFAGGVIFALTAKWLPVAAAGPIYALGASAAVMGMVVAAGVLAPNYIMRLLLIGDVKLKYIVAGLVFMDLIGMAGNVNTGGYIAHLGGSLFGWLFVLQLSNGTDWALPVNRLLDGIQSVFQTLFSRTRKRPKVVYKAQGGDKKQPKARQTRGNAQSDGNDQEKIDRILDKIKESGYDSLSAEEKSFLFNASKK